MENKLKNNKMSNSYYCSVCHKEVFEIKSEDNIYQNIGDMQILCEECSSDHYIRIERKIKRVWVICEKDNPDPISVCEHKPSREFLEMIESNTDTKVDVKEIELESFAGV